MLLRPTHLSDWLAFSWPAKIVAFHRCYYSHISFVPSSCNASTACAYAFCMQPSVASAASFGSSRLYYRISSGVMISKSIRAPQRMTALARKANNVIGAPLEAETWNSGRAETGWVAHHCGLTERNLPGTVTGRCLPSNFIDKHYIRWRQVWCKCRRRRRQKKIPYATLHVSKSSRCTLWPTDSWYQVIITYHHRPCTILSKRHQDSLTTTSRGLPLQPSTWIQTLLPVITCLSLSCWLNWLVNLACN